MKHISLNDQDMDLLRQVAASAKKNAIFTDLILSLSGQLLKLRDIERLRQEQIEEIDDFLNTWEEAGKVE